MTRSLSFLVLVAVLFAAGCGGDEKEAAAPAASPPAASVMCGDFDASALKGKAMAAAEAEAKTHGCTVRVERKDGKPFALTQDYNDHRIGVEVDDSVITRVTGIG